mgnify:CR=1 FL=1
MKNNEKSLMEEILGRKKDNSKNELLDNDDTLLNSTVHSLPKTEKLLWWFWPECLFLWHPSHKATKLDNSFASL